MRLRIRSLARGPRGVAKHALSFGCCGFSDLARMGFPRSLVGATKRLPLERHEYGTCATPSPGQSSASTLPGMVCMLPASCRRLSFTGSGRSIRVVHVLRFVDEFKNAYLQSWVCGASSARIFQMLRTISGPARGGGGLRRARGPRHASSQAASVSAGGRPR
jgi:hypothetical protein